MPGTLSRGYARRGGAVAVAGGGAKRSEVLLTTLAFFCLCWATFALLCYKVADVGGGRRPGGGTALSLSRKLISGSQSSSRGGHRQHASHRSPTSASSTTSGSSSSRAGHRKAARRASQTQGRRGQAPQRRASDDTAAAAAATGGGGNSGDLPFASASNCTRLGTRRFVLQDGRTVTPTIERIGSEWIFKYNRDVRYTHMATIEALPGVGLVCAWQAAPSSKVDGKFQPAVEGLGTQRIYYSFSTDEGSTWSDATPVSVPLPAAGRGENGSGAQWSPVLHADRKGTLWLFFTVSRAGCVYPRKPRLAEPGGDLVTTRCGNWKEGRPTMLSDLKANRWSDPATILGQANQHDRMASVIANKMKTLARSDGKTPIWVLPYWKEHSPLANVTSRGGACRVKQDQQSRSTSARTARLSRAGVLVSKNQGLRWKAHGDISHPATPLIEGALVQVGAPESEGKARGDSVGDRLLMLFRSRSNCAFSSTSEDGGESWSQPKPTKLPNPNSKFDMIQIKLNSTIASYAGQDLFLLAFNNHPKLGESSPCAGCRTHLSLAASLNGIQWQVVAHLDESMEPGIRAHYPTLLHANGKVYVAYSRFYISDLAASSQEQGIRVQTFSLNSISKFLSQHSAPLGESELQRVGDDFISRRTPSELKRFCCSRTKWIQALREMNKIYDFSNSGGMRFLSQMKDFEKYGMQKISDLVHRQKSGIMDDA